LSRAAEIRVSGIAGVPAQRNLVYQAARLLRDRFRVATGCRVTIEKRIPLAGGLGGGSSDAAATLCALRHLWDLDVPCSILRELATQLGSDVAFFLYGGAALVEGRGERVKPLPPLQRAWYALARPDVPVETRGIFSRLGRGTFGSGATTRRLAADLRVGRVPAIGVNDLQNTVFTVYPQARVCFELLAEIARGRALLSGSGPTSFGLFHDAESARAAAQHMRAAGFWSTTATGYTPPREAVPCRQGD
jgi:4-diphosphocytidyl-2-C-methyl-D-erythritol kinase